MKSVRIALKRRFRACHMRQRPRGHSIRQYYQFILLVIVSFLVALPAWSQNITLRPAVVERGGENLSTVLFRPSDIVTLRWEESVPGLELKVGEVPGYYGLKTVQMRGTQASSFSPEVVGLPVGVYYGVLTTSDEESYTSIQIDASADPDIRYSREFRFAVENTVTPRAITPRNSISERVPTFEWESVPGATAYALVVSSSPFTVAASGSSISDFEGLNPRLDLSDHRNQCDFRRTHRYKSTHSVSCGIARPREDLLLQHPQRVQHDRSRIHQRCTWSSHFFHSRKPQFAGHAHSYGSSWKRVIE